MNLVFVPGVFPEFSSLAEHFATLVLSNETAAVREIHMEDSFELTLEEGSCVCG